MAAPGNLWIGYERRFSAFYADYLADLKAHREDRGIFTVNHAAADGYHVHQFYAGLQADLDQLDWLDA